MDKMVLVFQLSVTMAMERSPSTSPMVVSLLPRILLDLKVNKEFSESKDHNESLELMDKTGHR